jgi:hypothetical protein
MMQPVQTVPLAPAFTHITEKAAPLLMPLLIGAIASQGISLIGQAYLGEILAIGYAALQFRLWKVSKFERVFLAMSLIWAGAQLLSDVWNNTPFESSLKGVFAPIVLCFTVLGLARYFRANPRRMPSFLLGGTLGQLAATLLFPDSYAQGNPWKWGVGACVLSLISIHYSFFRRSATERALVFFITVFSLVTLAFDARSLAGLPVFTLGIYWITRKQNGRIARLFSGRRGLLKLVLVLVPTVVFVNILISWVLSTSAVLELLPGTTAEKYRAQASGAYGILLGGRTEILVSSRAFFDHPWLGHGSWARDRSGEYISELASLRATLGYSESSSVDAASLELGLIPVHSYIMGALVWAGIFGGLFWLYLLSAIGRIFLRSMRELPYYYFIGMVMLAWNVLFSPFGASARWSTALFLASFLAYVCGPAVRSNTSP